MASILAVGAHPDDVELGMGATLAKLARLGHSVSILDLTDGEPTPCGTKEKRKKESQKSAEILGVQERITLEFPNRCLSDTTQARNEVASYIRRVRPEIVFCHFWIDRHPDHVAASKLSEAAAFYSKFTKSKIPGQPWQVEKIYYFYTVHLRTTINPSFIIDVSCDFQKKMDSLKAYKSQFVDNRQGSFVFDYLRRQGEYLGSLIGREYAEGFASRGPLGINDITDLVI